MALLIGQDGDRSQEQWTMLKLSTKSSEEEGDGDDGDENGVSNPQHRSSSTTAAFNVLCRSFWKIFAPLASRSLFKKKLLWPTRYYPITRLTHLTWTPGAETATAEASTVNKRLLGDSMCFHRQWISAGGLFQPASASGLCLAINGGQRWEALNRATTTVNTNADFSTTVENKGPFWNSARFVSLSTGRGGGIGIE